MNEEFRANDGFKVCRDCLERKMTDDFYLNNSCSDRYSKICRACEKLKKGRSVEKSALAIRKNPFRMFSFRGVKKSSD